MVSSVITSFGYRHGPAPQGQVVTVDTRVVLHDPPVHNPELRALTGFDEPVVRHVTAGPGARALVGYTAALVADLVAGAAGRAAGRRVDVAIGCAGGRHRSVVLAEAVAAELGRAGVGVEVVHRDVTKPLLPAAG